MLVERGIGGFGQRPLPNRAVPFGALLLVLQAWGDTHLPLVAVLVRFVAAVVVDAQLAHVFLQILRRRLGSVGEVLTVNVVVPLAVRFGRRSQIFLHVEIARFREAPIFGGFRFALIVVVTIRFRYPTAPHPLPLLVARVVFEVCAATVEVLIILDRLFVVFLAW